MDYTPPPKPPEIGRPQQPNLAEFLSKTKMKINQVKQKYEGYEKPKPPGNKAFSSKRESVDL